MQNKKNKSNQLTPQIQVLSTRKPRINGLTYLSLMYQKTQTEEDKDKVYSHIITIYTMQGFRYNGKSLSLPDLAILLKVPQNYIMDKISHISENLGGLIDKEKIESTLKSIITLSATWAIQDRGIIAEQVDLLLRSQNGQYRPFISGEVNKALKLILESNKNIMESYKTFFTSNQSTTNILNVINPGSQKDTEALLTPEKALQLISQNNKNQLPSGQPRIIPNNAISDQEALFREHGIGETPSCLENRSGREALMPVGYEALEPRSPEATDLKVKRSIASERRRGIYEEENDDLPNRE